MVDQDDYTVWRAHFGQIILPPAAGNEVSAAVALAPSIVAAAESTVGENSLSRSVSDPNHSLVSQGTNGEGQTLRQRKALPPFLVPASSNFAPTQSAVLGTKRAIAASRRDGALVAWLASQTKTKEPVRDFDDANMWDNEDASGVDVDMDSVERAFALLASS